MPKASFAPSNYKRRVAGANALLLKNRYFEKNPFLTDDGSALIARPGMTHFVDVGQGPIRGLYSQPGSFNGDLFTASYDTLYRIDVSKTITTVFPGLYKPETGIVNMVATASIGVTPAYLFFADGQSLYVYIENGFAHGLYSGLPVNNDVVQIDGVYYKYTVGSVNAGAPAGTLANPWLVAYTPSLAFTNLQLAINAKGTPGTTYSTALTVHPTVTASYTTGGSIYVRANDAGLLGNGISTTTTSAGAAWGAATLTGGGTPYVQKVALPNDVGAIDVAVSNSYVIVIPVQGDDRNGLFYWIEPGEIEIDPLNFATAESQPDAVLGVRTFGDQFWLPGESTTEVWYPTGNIDAPMQRMSGVVFDRGTWEGTMASVHESLIVCDANGAVFQIIGGQPKRISTPDIEEIIGGAINIQSFFNPYV